ncbi:AEC family transporter [Prosthecodimorpha staleyi]|uniref:AEC family transporter n=1 Tax=Prosthecodimorpha staleyi TaxID=2840188 RepID=A0A947D4Y6_9HYPH|nr:AEC family transporter [Prosthecodimorpha staleyi]MBT9288267.1 AEC family transporter [Prosthecodimorpha staleyi]
MNEVLTLALPFFGLIFIGYACGLINKIPDEGLAWLNFYIIYVSLPALFFQLLSKTPIEQLANWAYVAGTSFATAVALALGLVVGIFATRGNLREATIVAVGSAYSNIGYMGPGLTLAALGPAATVPTALIFCFDTVVLFTLIPLLMALGGENRERAGAMVVSILKGIFLHPFVIATMVGVGAAAIGFRPPVFIDKILNYLMGSSAPCALFALGVTVAQRPIRRVPHEIGFMLAIKLILHPVLVFVVLNWIGGFDRVWVMTATLMASLPPALNVFVIARQYNVYVERASSTVLIGTLVSVVTVTGMLYLISHDLLPLGLFGR